MIGSNKLNLTELIKRLYSKLNTTRILLIFIFAFSSIFFLLQHYWDLSWDFSAYVNNARYLFYGGDYYEVYRAPLASVFLGIFITFGKFGEYIYVIFVSTLFLFSNIKLSGSLYKKYFCVYDIKKEDFSLLFYLLSLNGFVLYYGLSIGTELLSLAFFELFLAFFIRNKYSGQFLGLAILCRYNFLAFLPLLLFNKKIKKILLNLLFLFIILLPWFIFNYLKWGYWITSIIDSFALNVVYRRDSAQAFVISDPFVALSWVAPFAIIGLFTVILTYVKNKDKLLMSNKIRYMEFLFFLILFLILYDYTTTPFKITRYLFNLSLPAAFFSSIFILNIKKKYDKIFKTIFVLIIILLAFSVFNLTYKAFKSRTADDMFYKAAKEIKRLDIQQCRITSPYWVPVYYYTQNTHPLYTIENSLENNEAVLIFKCCPTIDYNFNISQIYNYPILFNSSEFIILANRGFSSANCQKNTRQDNPMIDSPCYLVSNEFDSILIKRTVDKTCLVLNFKRQKDV